MSNWFCLMVDEWFASAPWLWYHGWFGHQRSAIQLSTPTVSCRVGGSLGPIWRPIPELHGMIHDWSTKTLVVCHPKWSWSGMVPRWMHMDTPLMDIFTSEPWPKHTTKLVSFAFAHARTCLFDLTYLCWQHVMLPAFLNFPVWKSLGWSFWENHVKSTIKTFAFSTNHRGSCRFSRQQFSCESEMLHHYASHLGVMLIHEPRFHELLGICMCIRVIMRIKTWYTYMTRM